MQTSKGRILCKVSIAVCRQPVSLLSRIQKLCPAALLLRFHNTHESDQPIYRNAIFIYIAIVGNTKLHQLVRQRVNIIIPSIKRKVHKHSCCQQRQAAFAFHQYFIYCYDGFPPPVFHKNLTPIARIAGKTKHVLSRPHCLIRSSRSFAAFNSFLRVFSRAVLL